MKLFFIIFLFLIISFSSALFIINEQNTYDKQIVRFNKEYSLLKKHQQYLLYEYEVLKYKKKQIPKK